jgi:hypothetical protein
LAIKVVEEGDYLVAKGSPAVSNLGYFFGILCYIAGGIMLLAGTLGAVIPGIIGTILIYGAAHYSKKIRQKKIQEYRNKLDNVVPISGVNCPKCHYLTGTMNIHCPNCGAKLHNDNNAELEETRKSLEAAQKRIEELEREKKGDDDERFFEDQQRKLRPK